MSNQMPWTYFYKKKILISDWRIHSEYFVKIRELLGGVRKHEFLKFIQEKIMNIDKLFFFFEFSVLKRLNDGFAGHLFMYTLFGTYNKASTCI